MEIIWIGNEFGRQEAMILSPRLFREVVRPRYAKLFQQWKTMNPRVMIAFHSEDNIYPLWLIWLRGVSIFLILLHIRVKGRWL